MIKILSGEMAIELHLQFLIRNNNTDLMILKNTKVRIQLLNWLKPLMIIDVSFNINQIVDVGVLQFVS